MEPADFILVIPVIIMITLAHVSDMVKSYFVEQICFTIDILVLLSWFQAILMLNM